MKLNQEEIQVIYDSVLEREEIIIGYLIKELDQETINCFIKELKEISKIKQKLVKEL